MDAAQCPTVHRERIAQPIAERMCIDNSILKQCFGCKEVLPIQSFRNAGKRKDGSIKKEARCRECRKKENKDYLDNRCDKARKYNILKDWKKRREDNGGIVPDKEYKCQDCGTLVVAKIFRIRCYDCRLQVTRSEKELRRKRLQNTYSELVRPEKVFNRDKWQCKICRCKVQKKNIYKDNAAEIDHILPISLGGVHTYTNVQTLCRKCNLFKSNRLIGQLILAL